MIKKEESHVERDIRTRYGMARSQNICVNEIFILKRLTKRKLFLGARRAFAGTIVRLRIVRDARASLGE